MNDLNGQIPAPLPTAVELRKEVGIKLRKIESLVYAASQRPRGAYYLYQVLAALTAVEKALLIMAVYKKGRPGLDRKSGDRSSCLLAAES